MTPRTSSNRFDATAHLFRAGAGIAGITVALPLFAFELQLGPIDLAMDLSVSTGATWRLESQATQFIGKTNINGQQELCESDNCLSFTGDPTPNQRLVDAKGGFFTLNSDNGNLNYEPGDIVYATTRVIPKLNLTWGDWYFKASALGYYDPANTNFQEHHPNTNYQPAKTRRPERYEDDFAYGARLNDLALNGYFRVLDHSVSIGIGQQLIRWGEANTLLFSTLNQINPLDATAFRMPGAQLSEITVPIPSALIGIDLGGGFSLDLIGMLDWKPVRVDSPGSFMSTSDVAGGGEYVIVGLGQFSEDPNGNATLAAPANLATSTSFTAEVLPEDYGYPQGSGNEYGAKLGYFADWLNDGTELGLYYLHYNSRLPYASVLATDASCARDAADFVTALIVCQGGTGTLDNLVPGEGLEILPIDTKKIFLEYPENLDMAGFSFNTNLGDWALAGEFAYHLQLPIQVQIVDVVFAGLNPAFPRQDLRIGLQTISDIATQVPVIGDALSPLDALLGLPVEAGVPQLTLPSADVAVPSFLARYRGEDIQPNQRISGFERFDVGQLVLNGLRIFQHNPIGADQLIVLGEAAITHIIDLPALDVLQFEGGGDNTHYSPGADGTGSNGEPDARRVNPTQQTSSFATATAWGYRALLRATYTNVFGRYSLHPTLLWQHDIQGTSPYPMQNFMQGRKFAWFFVDWEITRQFNLQLSYQAYFGADDRNLLVDRDNAGFSLKFDF